jgi:hypothetical protein
MAVLTSPPSHQLYGQPAAVLAKAPLPSMGRGLRMNLARVVLQDLVLMENTAKKAPQIMTAP